MRFWLWKVSYLFWVECSHKLHIQKELSLLYTDLPIKLVLAENIAQTTTLAQKEDRDDLLIIYNLTIFRILDYRAI